ncbi:hypothetical protein FB567DRAFT_482944 [Paraphoma chrysanthemicola]|uniref:C3H1-type domain-containing protein n=1 Tax=Paraphoma chrysanthemicola TaxID=798071 RepID=A0A8K0VSE6_9PLEO|nr:hypothetical protein FB567DRAFT_482944 [Paraphoma chrysanthemicola]
MLADGKIDSLDTHLEQFKLNNQTAQSDLQNLLREYGQLLNDYKDLKKTLESKKSNAGARAPAKSAATVAAGKARNPYVLVLIDGDGYIFNDELIRDKEEGGMRAARMLNDAVEKYLQQSVPEARNARVVVRIYADLTNLSKQLAKAKLAGLEKRSLAPFSAAFTRAISLFDFVDALDEEGTKFKIRDQLKIASDDSACTHILFAACHDSAYLSTLVPFSGLREKLTLVQAAGWNSEFHQFNLNVTEFPTIFRWSDLPAAAPATKATQANGNAKPAPKKAPSNGPSDPRQYDTWRNDSAGAKDQRSEAGRSSSMATNGHANETGTSFNGSNAQQKSSSPLCRYFQKGFCRFGNKCTFQHVPPTLNATSQQPQKNSKERSNVSEYLPTGTSVGYIPLNKDAQRLDLYMRPPSQEEWSIYNTRFHKQKPCNNFHLQRVCTTFGCPYDHQELEPEARHVLEYVLKCSPCPRKSECRQSDCFYGHICQKDGCQGQMKGCRMKADLHNVDPKMVNMVPAEDEEELVHYEPAGVQMPNENGYLW